MKNLLFILLAGTLLFSCNKEEDRPFPPEIVINCIDVENVSGNITDQEEYEIIQVILDEYYSPGKFHILENSEPCNSFCEGDISYFLDSQNILYDLQTVENYISKNDSVSYWMEQFNSSEVLINQAEFRCFFDIGLGWESYYSKYENSSGVLQFGRPATNGTNEAIVLYSLSCNLLCGEGNIVLLEKNNGNWQVKEKIITWIS